MKKILAILCLSGALVACGEKNLDVKTEIDKSNEKMKIELDLPTIKGKVSEEVKTKLDNINKIITDKAAEIEASQETISADMPHSLEADYEVYDNKDFGVKSILIDTALFQGGANEEKAKVAVNINTKDNTEYDLNKILTDEQKANVLTLINNAIDSKQNFDGLPLNTFGDHVNDFSELNFYFQDDIAKAYFLPATIAPASEGFIEFGFSQNTLLMK